MGFPFHLRSQRNDSSIHPLSPSPSRVVLVSLWFQTWGLVSSLGLRTRQCPTASLLPTTTRKDPKEVMTEKPTGVTRSPHLTVLLRDNPIPLVLQEGCDIYECRKSIPFGGKRSNLLWSTGK